MEKFIQVPFGLPQPDEKSINEMLMGMSGQMKEEKKEQAKKTKTKQIETGAEAEEQPPSELSGEVPKTKTAKMKKGKIEEDEKLEEKERDIRQKKIEKEFLKFDGDDFNFRTIVLTVSKAFEFNPRRAKQFVNIFRLRAATAKVTGLYEPKEGKRITFEQLGKFVGIGLGWPLLIRDIERRPELLEELVEAAEGRKEEEANERKEAETKGKRFEKWVGDEKLMELLKAGCENQEDVEMCRRFSLKGLSVNKLLQVAPSVMGAEEKTVQNMAP
ncbi:MAG: P-loop NTPase fold protein [Sedimentisphaerales bacterium]|nr:P-loop NTPase fold protein [Sedimentisphaerales bacterium]